VENRPPYEVLGVTLEERFEFVDLTPEPVRREPRVIFQKGQLDRREDERNSA
jgi:hypothetical protein